MFRTHIIQFQRTNMLAILADKMVFNRDLDAQIFHEFTTMLCWHCNAWFERNNIDRTASVWNSQDAYTWLANHFLRPLIRWEVLSCKINFLQLKWSSSKCLRKREKTVCGQNLRHLRETWIERKKKECQWN